MARKIGRDERDWQDLAVLDPYWAALTEDSKRYGEWTPSEFAAVGARDVDRLLTHAATLGFPVQRGRVLDFGCGPGRLARALAEQFDSYLGVDVSEEMAAVARSANGDVPNARFLVGEGVLAELGEGEFDLVYSNLVLQHVSDPSVVAQYVRELARVLAPRGLLALQIPSHIPYVRRIQPRRRLYGILRRAGLSPGFLYGRLRLDPVSMHAVTPERIRPALRAGGGQLVSFDEEEWETGIRSATYFATKSDR